MNEDRTTSARRKNRKPEIQPVATLASVPRVSGEISNRVESFAREPSHDEIARRAYQLYEARGGEPGRDWEDWLQAEEQLRVTHVSLADPARRIFDSA
jgi:hypothetical protein